MKQINFVLIAIVGFTGYTLGSIVSDIGETKPSYVVGWDMPLTMLAFCSLYFYAGYLTKENKNGKS